MNTKLIISIITGYENQLANAEINNDSQKIQWLKDQIDQSHKLIANAATYTAN